MENSDPVMPANVRFNRTILVFTMLVSLLMGGVGGALSVYVLTGGNSGTSGLISGNNSGLKLPVYQKVTLDEGSKFIDVAKQMNPSVVAITTSRSVSDFFGQVFEQKGGGSGFIITSDGLIATNKHVVKDSKATYTVLLNDGTTHEAKVQSLDPIFDFAVIKIDAKNLKAVEFGDSDSLQVGQWVLAIGNALAEFQNTVTAGIISAKERSITAGDASGGQTESLDGLLQTDAAVNPGNSGGPMVNTAGQVIGVVTAVAGDAQGISFALPINVLKPAVESVIKSGRIIRPALGVRYTTLTKAIAETNKLPVDHGAYLRLSQNGSAPVIAGSAADKAGLKVGDIITAVNSVTIDESHTLARLVQQYKVGDKIKLSVNRDGKESIIEVMLEEFKS